VHGFRGSFRKWVDDVNSGIGNKIDRNTAESVLAHRAVGDATELSYRDKELIKQRRTVLQAWADFVTTPPAQVIQLAA